MFLVGGTVRVFENFRNPLRFAREVDHLALRTFCGVPSTFHTLATLNRLSPITMSTVRVVCSAGGAMDRSLLPTIKSVFPNATFFDNYGMTEAAPRITFIRDDDPHFSRGSCGRPIDGVELRILDERTLKPLPEGEIGVVALRGPNVFTGYLNDEAATREAFTSDGFLLSGDLGCLKEGYLYLHGRRDEVFNVGGEKIGPLEIERVLADHELIRSSAVASMTDAGRGLVPVAYLELNGPIDRKSLVAFLRSRLPPTKIPWRFFEVKGYPMTPNGKVIRRRLAPDDANFVVREVI
jgi:acyl-coenzyme A synthetase/AMP-(fatty) acid ligase